MKKMEPRWNEKQQRWIASTGSGKNRRWAKSRIPGEQGKAICQRKLNKLYQDVEGPKPLPPGSLAEFIEEVYWPMQHAHEQSTKDTYRQKVLDHIAPLFLHKVEDIKFTDLQNWVNDLQSKKKINRFTLKDGTKKVVVSDQAISTKTVRDVYFILSEILTVAHRLKRVTTDFWKLVEIPDLPVRAPVALEPAEVKKLLNHIEGTWIEGPVWASVTLGLRREIGRA